MKICLTCYREVEDNEMKQQADGGLSRQCKTCYDMIGKGAGYSDFYSDEEVERWLEGLSERKHELINEGKLEL